MNECSLVTTMNTIIPGYVKDGKRAVLELAALFVQDAGADGMRLQTGTTFLMQGLFVP